MTVSPPGVQEQQATSTLAHHRLHIRVLLHIYILFRTSLGPMLQARGRVEVKARPARLALRNPFYDSATLTWKTSDWLDNALASENQGIVTARDHLDELMPLCSLLGLFCLSGNACKGPKFTRNSA